MAFHDVRISTEVERGAVGGPRFNTTVQRSPLNGKEVRVQNWSQAQSRWQIGYGVNNRERASEIVNFFTARRGRLHSFRFRDWSDYLAVNEPLADADGSETEFQLRRTYGPQTQLTYTRKITKPVVSTVRIVNTPTDTGTPVEIDPLSFGVDPVTGIVVFTVAPQAGKLSWSGEFDIPVRFDTDSLDIAVIHVDAMQIPDITIVEVDE